VTEQLVRSLYVALADGDRETLQRLLDPDFRGVTTDGLPLNLGGTYEGAVTMLREFWGRIGRHYQARAEPERIDVLSDGRLLVTGRYHGKAIASGRTLDAAFVHVVEVVDGRIVALEQLTDSAAWSAALEGLQTITYDVTDGLATIRLNRPDVRNAIDLRMGEETLEVARRVSTDPAVRAVLIAGNGPALTVGGDITYFRQVAPEEYGELFHRMTTPFHEAFRILSRLDAPIVTAAHGAVAGGGLGYVYAADIVLAADDATFLTAFAGIGLSGDGGGTWHLPRLVGPRRAARMYLENTPIDARTAAEWGLITEVVPAGELQQRALETARRLASGPTQAYARMRRLLREAWNTDLSEHLFAETDGVRTTGATRDARTAIAAFAAKRRPTFEGR
jgi:2-(1,2-epoxy-1,2-dihydrophenyl)acetyl-CoA isomerase